MDRSCISLSALRDRLAALVKRLFGCSHRRTTFPITLPSIAGWSELTTCKPDTYVVCLECGSHLAYDWSAMRITKREAPFARSGMGLGKPPAI